MTLVWKEANTTIWWCSCHKHYRWERAGAWFVLRWHPMEGKDRATLIHYVYYTVCQNVRGVRKQRCEFIGQMCEKKMICQIQAEDMPGSGEIYYKDGFRGNSFIKCRVQILLLLAQKAMWKENFFLLKNAHSKYKNGDTRGSILSRNFKIVKEAKGVFRNQTNVFWKNTIKRTYMVAW